MYVCVCVCVYACMRVRACAYRDHGALAWVQDTQGLVLAGGQDLGAVPVPAGAVDEVCVDRVHPHHLLPAGHVPQDQHVVTACRGRPGAAQDGGWCACACACVCVCVCVCLR